MRFLRQILLSLFVCSGWFAHGQIAGADVQSTSESVPITFNPTSNDIDLDGTIDPGTVDLDILTPGIQSTVANSDGGYNVTPAGDLTYQPAPGFTGIALLSYNVNDNDGNTTLLPGLITITVSANGAPVANDDATSTSEDVTATLNVVSNDTDATGTIDPATVDLNVGAGGIQNTNTTAAGSWSVAADGTVTLVPLSNVNGPATLNYTVNDFLGATSNEATITITVNSVNDNPTAANDATTTAEDTPVAGFNITSNDTDIDGTIATGTVDLNTGTAGIQATNTTPAGSWSVTAGALTFTPVLNFNGPAALAYTVEDNQGGVSGPATITITVTAVNDRPDAVDDATTTPEETLITLNVTTNDSDVDGSVNPASVDLDTGTPGIQTTMTTAAGNWSVATDGVVSFTPASDFTGAATLPYTINDNLGLASDPATITITVTNSNDPPTAVNDAASTPEETAGTVSVVANDTDDDGSINVATVDINTGMLGIQTTNATAQGNWTAAANGSVTFTPLANYNGPASLTYTVNDNDGAASNVATITFTVTAVNDAPTANGDNATTLEETAVTLNVTSNDTDIDGTINAGSVDLNTGTGGIQTSNTTPAGAWTVNGSGDVTFTPALDFTGPATLTYTVNDNGGATSNAATISITVSNDNDPPTAVNDSGTTPEETSVGLNIVSNDTDADGTVRANTVDLNTGVGGQQTTNSTVAGAWSVNGSGQLTFVPATDFNGPATLNYTVNDNDGATSNVATITITVTAVNDAPDANDDNGTTAEETAVTLNVVGNDTDIDGTINAASVDLNTGVAGIQASNTTPAGAWTVNGSGDVTYTPAANFNGVATLTYRVNDNGGATSANATISITVTGVNDPPQAVNDAVTTSEETLVTHNVVANDIDTDGTVNAATVDLDPGTAGIQTSDAISGGNITVNTSGVITFTPTFNFYGATSATYTVNDNTGATSNVATISINVTAVNDPPVASNDLAAADENETVSLNVVTNDIDFDGTVNPATVDLNPSAGGIQTTITIPAGTFTVDATGLVTYVPSLNYNGIASITYTVRDNSGATSNAATISINVNSINSDPVANNDGITINEDGVASLNIVSNDVDPDGSINAATVDLNTTSAGIQNTLSTAQGAFSVSGTGMLTFTPTSNFNGTVTLNYTVNDNVGATSNIATVTITVTSVNDLPTANNDASTTGEGDPVTFTVVTNDTDVDGTIDPATVDLNTGTAGIQNTNTTAAGSWSVSAAGMVTFTPVAGFNGAATLTYRVNDNSGGTSNAATITVNVNSVNDPPVANNDAATTPEDVAVMVNVVANDTDPESALNIATVDLNTTSSGIQTSVTVTGGAFAVNAAGVVTFTPTGNFNGSASTMYTVNDNLGLTSNAATITITVTAVNDPPVAVADGAATAENTAVTFNVVSNDSDPDAGGSIDPATVDLNTTASGIQNTATTAAGSWSVNPTGNVTFTPATNFSGAATLQYRVNDNNGTPSNAATITVSVDGINDPPFFATIADQTVAENSGAHTITITGVTAGPGESAQLLTWIPSSGNTSVISTPVITPGAGGTAQLAYNVMPNVSGPVVITVNLVDNGSNVAPNQNSYTQTFTINVVEVNAAPTLNAITFGPIAEDAGLQSIPLTGISAGPGEDQPLTVTVSTNRPDLFDPAPSIVYTSPQATGTLRLTPKANANGTAQITVRVEDNGPNSPAPNVNFITRVFNLVITPVNDLPVFTSVPRYTVNLGDTYSYTITATDVDGETLVITAVTKPAWATLTPVSNGRATLAGPANVAGSTNVRIQVKDPTGAPQFQDFVLVVNTRPTITPFAITTDEDVPKAFTLEQFTAAYADGNGDALDSVKIGLLPRHGVLTLGGVPVAAGSRIAAEALAGLVYEPGDDYTGRDTLTWNATDGISYAVADTYVSMVVVPVNDAPIITALETDTLAYAIGGEIPALLTTLFDAIDPDGDSITSVEIGFRSQNFKPENDRLLYTSTATITGTYNSSTGTLLLSGKAPAAEYVQAIRTIQYNFVDLTEILTGTKSVYFTLSDGKKLSETEYRYIRTVYEFEEIDIPNAFTPNGDGSNDVWKITADKGVDQYSNAKVRIYNKRGSLVFEAKGLETFWDGTMGGDVLPVDTYYYTIDLNYNRITYRGIVTILR